MTQQKTRPRATRLPDLVHTDVGVAQSELHQKVEPGTSLYLLVTTTSR